MKYINAEKLKRFVESIGLTPQKSADYNDGRDDVKRMVLDFIDSLQQERPNDVCAEIKEYYGEELAFEDERTKAAYHFFSAGKAFELREYEEERKKHITDLLDNFKRGMKAGYEKAISELKEGKVECSPVMKDFINKFFELGNTYNFGFGPKNIQQEKPDMGEVSDGYHTFNELYYYRMLYNAAFFNLLPKEWVHKSKRYHDGEECFGGGWFIVMANLPTGQISNHYELKDWDLFQIPEKEIADEWDGHTPQEAAERLYKYLQQKQLNKEFLNESEQAFVDLVTERMLREGPIPTLNGEQKIAFEKEFNRFKQITGMINWPGYIEVYKKVILWFMAWGADKLPNLGKPIDPTKIDIQQEQPEMDLENYISNKLFELGADLINHKPYSFNRGLNVGKANAYHDILDRLNVRKDD